MTTEAKQFHISVVMTVIGGKLLCQTEEVYKFLNYMTGESVFTHQIPRVMREAGPVLLKQHPQLKGVTVPEFVNVDAVHAFVEALCTEYGDYVSVIPMDVNEHESIDPMSEAAEMFPPDKIITVSPPNKEQ